MIQDALFNLSKTCQMSKPSPYSIPWPARRPSGLLGVTQSLPTNKSTKAEGGHNTMSILEETRAIGSLDLAPLVS
jgi:hypothetical protein